MKVIVAGRVQITYIAAEPSSGPGLLSSRATSKIVRLAHRLENYFNAWIAVIPTECLRYAKPSRCRGGTVFNARFLWNERVVWQDAAVPI